MTTVAEETRAKLDAAVSPVAEEMAPPPQFEWADLREMAARAATEAGEWAGAPIPVAHVPLVMEPRYPIRGLNGLRLDPKKHVAADDSYTLLNEWYSYHRNARVYVCREQNGKSRGYVLPEGSGVRLSYWLNTLGVAAGHVWATETEARACEKLASLVSTHAMNCYTLAGGFLETSPRSRVTYLFRKLRPTLAMRPGPDGQMVVLAALCLHPIGFYAETWAGVMCPTDDVVAHLMLMRGDEHGFWKKANHHPMWMASSGV